MTAVIGTFSFLNGENGFNALDLNRTSYKKALELEHKGEYKNAYYAFKKVATFYPAYDAVLYHQSDCAAKIEDEKTAIKKLENLIDKYPKSKLLPAAYYKLGQAYFRTGRYTSSERTFRKLAKKYPNSDYRIAAYYYVGLLNKKKNPTYAVSLWKEYLKLSPEGRFGVECIKELQKIKAPLSNTDRINIGIAYYFAGHPLSAINQLKNLPVNKSWYYLAQCYVKTGQNANATETVKKGITYYSRNFSQDDLQEMVKLYVRLNPKPKLESWQDAVYLTCNTSVHDYALYNLAKVSPKDKSVGIYNCIISNYPNSDFASESLWELMWNAYKSHNYNKAIHIANVHRTKFKNSVASAKVLFWTGKILEKQGQRHEAGRYYDEILQNYNINYYAFRANGRKRALMHLRDTLWGTKPSNRLCDTFYNIKTPVSGLEIKKTYGDSFWELLQVGDYDLIEDYKIQNKALISWISYQKDLPTKSCLLARNIIDAESPNPNVDEEICKLAFPLHYTEEVNYWGKRNRMDSAIIISVLKEESYFNPKAVSNSDAYGLMQLLPSTAAHICSKRGIFYKGKNSLFNPETNIQLGSTYLRSLYDETGSMLYAVASYNAGPGAVNKWLKENQTRDIDEFIEDIPYQETQNYVRKVYRSYWCYSRMY